MTKCCTRCKVVKPVEEFYRRGDYGWRPACKACSAEQAKEYAQGHRYQGPPTEEIPKQFRIQSYHSVIDRMVLFGIMSETTAEESRERVSKLEDA